MILIIALPLVLCTDLFNHPVNGSMTSNVVAIGNWSNLRSSTNGCGIFAHEVDCYSKDHNNAGERLGSTR